jgi:hypothetical protein
MVIKRLFRSLLALSVLLVSVQAYASTGNIIGSLENTDGTGYTVTAKQLATGRSMTVKADSGSFRFSQMDVGQYEVTVSQNGQAVARDMINVRINSNVPARFVLQQSIEEIITTAQAISGETYSTDSGLVINLEELSVMPVARNITAVSLLAPGTVLGDSRFSLSNGSNGLVSFGGSSVAENSCYINGLEVTNTRQGLGCGSVPFEFYDQFQVKTGGYSAQYGRTTGGVLNAVTKSGTNEWKFGAGIYLQPESGYEEGKKSYANDGSGTVFRDTSDDSYGENSLVLTAGGPIIKDKLFVYALIEQRDTEQNFSDNTGREAYSVDDEYREVTASGGDNLFWGAKIDWDITDNHQLSTFGYSNRSDAEDVHYFRDATTGIRDTESSGSFLRSRGGEAWNVTYTGHLTDSLTVKAMYGSIETQYLSEASNTVCPLVTDSRDNPTAQGCGPGGSTGTNFDENDQTRFDVEYAVGNHVIRAGLDKQDRGSERIILPAGGISAIVYNTLQPGAVLNINSNPGGVYTNTTGAEQDYVSQRIFVGGGPFNSELNALYIEDEWAINDNFVLYLGARKDQLKNFGSTGVKFVDFDQDWAPRLGVSWDPKGDGESKVYGTWGRYYLPVANNTNYRVAANISDETVYQTFTGVNAADGTPTGTVPITGDLDESTQINSFVGQVGLDVFQSQGADPFYKEELILGYERTLNDEYSLGLRVISRDVGVTLDDYCGFAAPTCVMLNPGSAGAWGDDFDFDGEPDGGIINEWSVEEIGLPEGVNEYTSIQVELDRVTDRTAWSFIYTWGRSVGNFEGAVKSDIVQADAGITQDFDFPALMDGAFGYLPNDRRHSFKFFGSFGLTEDLTLGWNATLASGRPRNQFGAAHPEADDPTQFGSYGDTFYIFTNRCDEGGTEIDCVDTALEIGSYDCSLPGNPHGCTGPDLDDEDGDLLNPAEAAQFQDNKIYNFVPRGSNGRTPWSANLDVSLNYNFEMGGTEMTAGLKIYNILDIQEATNMNDAFEQRRSEGTLNPYYNAAYAWQAPRHWQLSLVASF